MLTGYKYRKLRGRIVEKYGSQRKFATSVHLTPQSVVNKLGGRSEFSQSDIITWCAVLDIPQEQISEYFFA